jgi:hypothetical protein
MLYYDIICVLSVYYIIVLGGSIVFDLFCIAVDYVEVNRVGIGDLFYWTLLYSTASYAVGLDYMGLVSIGCFVSALLH